ncbi:hypothetical protein B0A48_07964 [Cryoendolithus antarcticus]|uniref:Protein kinase domain-containing protein n=1 Tax=Cryoendolithus antarcticus TaxID=1507870 RepID=A0A1V8T0M2_9PEZI|nr:hypothetical protein B0A48_07964 [Cryoendolithus antarcticus]
MELGRSRPYKKRLRDAEFDRIASLCESFGRPKWARRPRHFFILYMIGHMNMMDDLVSEGASDISLPYTNDNLPKFLTGEARERFMEYQTYVLNGQGKLIEQGGQAHQWINGTGDDWFIYQRSLGRGGFGEVDDVIGKWSSANFARKRVPKGEVSIRSREGQVQFENEMMLLKNLSHRHIVKLFGTYTDRDYMVLVMQPVADKNLKQFLVERLDDRMRESRQIRLRCLFGCIATAIQYLHQAQVRHKDIKPPNILIKGEKVFITDFGTSHHWEGDLADVTEGTHKGAVTRKYLAPEAHTGNRRSKSTDIWSLGCVFLEMCTVLTNRTLEDLANFLTNHGSKSSFYGFNHQGIVEWSQELRKDFEASENPKDTRLLDLIAIMCEEVADRRLSADEVVAYLFRLNAAQPYYGPCCSPRSKEDACTEWMIAGSISEHADCAELVNEARASIELVRRLTDDFSDHPQHIQPTVEDADITMLEINIAPKASNAILEDITEITWPVNPTKRLSPLHEPGQEGMEDEEETAVEGHTYAGRPANCTIITRDQEGTPADSEPTHLVSTKSLPLGPDSGALMVGKSAMRQRREESTRASVKFADLTEERRPAQNRIKAAPISKGPDHRTYSIKAEMPVAPDWASVPDSGQTIRSGVPPSSLVPSYILASRNRFSKQEMRHVQITDTQPLFVYEDGRRLDKWQETQMRRVDVQVQINLADHAVLDVQAFTYQRLSRQRRALRNRSPERPWVIDHFVKSSCFNRFVAKHSSSTWAQEERHIAQALQTRFVLIGDHLVQKVMVGDHSGVATLLDVYDVDSPSAQYGTALQAAAYQGHVAIVNLLLDAGARPDAKGGEYGSALIAAVVQDHPSIVKTLLREGADVFTPGGRYINALYQAVDFDNLPVAHMLLEKGAWLTRGYGELLDLARERNNAKMQDELQKYSIQESVHSATQAALPYTQKVLDIDGRPLGRERGQHIWVRPRYKEMSMPLLWAVAKLQGEKGKWTGIKGVHLMRIALEHGLDISLIEKLRPHLNNWPSMQRVLTESIGEGLGAKLRPIKHTDPESQLRYNASSDEPMDIRRDASRARRTPERTDGDQSLPRRTITKDYRYRKMVEDIAEPLRRAWDKL